MATTPAREPSSINFQSMLGGPLIAVVNAQAQAAMSTVNFIKAVGFKPGDASDPTAAQTGDPIYVRFKYPKEVAPFEPAQPARISGIAMTNPGTGYTAAPQVTIGAPPHGGTQATVSVSLGAGGSLSISLTDPGSGYTAAPQIQIGAPPAGGTQAVATATFAAQTAAVPRLGFRVRDLEAQVIGKGQEVPIRVEQRQTILNAPCRNQGVNGLPYGDSH